MNGYFIAKGITKKHAKTFYFASRFLPFHKQRAAYSVYALCRLSDDSVDNAINQRAELQEIRQKIAAAYTDEKINDPLVRAFQETVKQYDIPKVYFDELLSGMEMDIIKKRYANSSELYSYCYKVAGVIGLIMLKIFGTNDEKAQQYAVNLGIAMQLTNILRDIKEDYARGRVYIPQDEMAQFKVTEDYIAQEKVNSRTIALMQYEIRKAQNYYMRAERGFSLITDKRSRFVARAMSHMYEGILIAIERNCYNIFKWRANVSLWGKIGRTLQILSLRD